MEHYSLVEAFLDKLPGKPSLDMLLNDHFMENVHVSKLHPMYFVHFLLGFSSMMLTTENRAKYGIEHIFFGHYPEENVARVMILTKTDEISEAAGNGPSTSQNRKFNDNRRLHIRTFFLGPQKSTVHDFLTAQEYELMKETLLRHSDSVLRQRIFSLVQKNGLVPHQLVSSYLMDGVKELVHECEKYNPKLMHNIRNMQQQSLDEANLDTYVKNYRNYVIDMMKIYKDDSRPRQRTKFAFIEIFNEDITAKRIGHAYGNSIKLKFQDFYNKLPKFSINDFDTSNSLFIMNNEWITYGDQSVHNNVKLSSMHFSQMFKEFELKPEKFKKSNYVSFFNSLKVPYRETMFFLDAFYQDKSQSTECAFSHGALLAMRNVKATLDIKVFQYVPTSYDLTWSNHRALERVNDFYILMQFQPSSIVKKVVSVPAMLTFHRRRSVTAKGLEPLTLSKEYLAIDRAFKSNGPIGTWMEVERADPISAIMELMKLEGKNEMALANFEFTFLQSLKSIKSVAMEHPIMETKYLSRHFLGLLSTSAQLQNENCRVYVAETKAGQHQTTFLIEKHDHSRSTSEIKKSRILIIFDEQPMIFTPHVEPHTSLDEFLQDSVSKKFDDTIVVHVKQVYANTRVDFLDNDYSQDFVNIDITTGYTKFSTLLHHYYRIKHVQVLPMDQLLSEEISLGNVGRFHSLLSSYLQEYSSFISYPEDFKAFLDGIFLKYKTIKSIIPIRSSLSTVQYSFLHDSTKESDDNHGPGENEPKNLITLNFKMPYDPVDDKEAIQIGIDAVSAMINENEEKGNTAVDFFTFVVSKQDKFSLHSVGKQDVLLGCDLARRKRGVGACAIEEYNEQTKDLIHYDEMKTIEKLPKPSIRLLNDLEKISNFLMMGIMLRDAITDAAHGHKLAFTKDVGFLLTTLFSPKLSKLASSYGEKLILDEAKLAGYSLKAFGLGVSKAISIYILYDFISNTVDYAKNTNDTSALMSMSVDGAFLAIDALTLAVEGLEAIGVISGISAATGPLGAAIGAAIVIGLNVYQTVKKVEQIDAIIDLNECELIEESVRAFFHMDPESHIQVLLSEKVANDYIMNASIKVLQQESNIDTFITSSGRIVNGTVKLYADSIIDMRTRIATKISRASPTPQAEDIAIACYLHQEQIEEDQPGFWEKVKLFFSKVERLFSTVGHYLLGDTDVLRNDTTKVDQHDQQLIDSYTCKNSFGIQKKMIRSESYAWFDLGDGNDFVIGFKEKRNIFHIANGTKNVTGGNKDDIFILSSANLSGVLNGGDTGVNKISFLTIAADSIAYKNQHLEIKNGISFNRVKLVNIRSLVGRRNQIDNIICDCSIGSIQTFGGTSKSADNIIVPYSNCHYNLTVHLEGKIFLQNDAKYGDFTYIINSNNKTSDIKLVLNSLTQDGRNHIFIKSQLTKINHLNISRNKTRLLAKLALEKLNVKVLLYTGIARFTKLQFMDGPIMIFDSNVTTLVLNTELPVEAVARTYAKVAKRLNVPMVAYSRMDNESITFTHGDIKVRELNSNVSARLLHIIHNPLDHPGKMMLNGGEYLILVKAQKQLDGERLLSLNVPKLTLIPDLSKQIKVAIDLSGLNSQIKSNNFTGEVKISGLIKNSDLNLDLVLQQQNGSEMLMGNIVIMNTYLSDLYSNITIVNHGELKVTNRMNNSARTENNHYQHIAQQNGCLQPLPLKYNENFHFIILSADIVEWYHAIHINLAIGNYDYYQVNQSTLLITNARYNALWDYTNMCTIIVENFYNVKKLQTLTFVTIYRNIDLATDKKLIMNAGNLTDMWQILDRNSETFDSHF